MTLNWKSLPEIKDSDFLRPDFKVWFQGIVRGVFEQNKEVEAEAARQYSVMLQAARALYSEGSNEVRYLKKAGIPDPVNNAAREKKVWSRWEKWKQDQIDTERRRWQAEERAKRKQERQAAAETEALRQQAIREQELAEQRAYAQDYRRRKTEAVAALEAKGFVAGVSFDPGEAISFLKRISTEEGLREAELELEYRNYEG